MVRISDEGIALIKRWEGLELEAYYDIAGILTIGYGHTGPDVFDGQEITEDEAEELLRRDVDRFEAGVNDAVTAAITQSMFDALVSFSYNVGLGALRSSTALKRLNKGDYIGAAEALTWWNKARINGKLQPSRGLTRRRAAEKALFLSDLDEVEEDDNGLDSRGGDIVEEKPRRSNPVTTRTTGGAVTAGVAGATGAGAVLLDEEEGGEGAPTGDSGSAGGQAGPDTGTEPDDGPETPEDSDGTGGRSLSECQDIVDAAATVDRSTLADEVNAVIDACAAKVAAEAPAEPQADPNPEDADPDAAPEAIATDPAADGGAPDADTDDANTTDEPAPQMDEEAADEVLEAVADNIREIEVGRVTVEVPQSLSGRDASDAIAVAAGLIAVLAAIYVIHARIDDWRKFRR